VLRNLDRVCFVLAAMLLLRRREQALFLAAGLGVGYIFAAAIALLGWIVPRAELIDAFLGFLVAMLAANMVARSTARPRTLAGLCAAALLLLAVPIGVLRGASAAALLVGAAACAGGFLSLSPRLAARPLAWLGPAAVFALLDGFELPALVAPMQLPARTLLPMLSGFDLGALSSELLWLLLFVAGYLLLRRKRFLPPASLIQDLGATAFGGCGVFWLLTRLYG
jgi:hypothetical protein